MKASDPRMKAWLERDYSWSQHDKWDWSKEEWYERYILGLEQTDESPALKFGKKFGEAAEWGKPLAPVTQYRLTEHGIRAPLEDFHVIGYLDAYDRAPHDPKSTKIDGKGLRFVEYKTGSKAWTQKRVNEHGQLTFYCMLLWLRDRIKPEDVEILLEWVPTGTLKDYTFGIQVDEKGEAKVHQFETKRTMRDVVKLIAEIQTRRKEMYAYARAHK